MNTIDILIQDKSLLVSNTMALNKSKVNAYLIEFLV
jgi:hypothetical protein